MRLWVARIGCYKPTYLSCCASLVQRPHLSRAPRWELHEDSEMALGWWRFTWMRQTCLFLPHSALKCNHRGAPRAPLLFADCSLLRSQYAGLMTHRLSNCQPVGGIAPSFLSPTFLPGLFVGNAVSAARRELDGPFLSSIAAFTPFRASAVLPLGLSKTEPKP